ncbi:hypothetical protein BT96DRAFT_400227 [Gymnopus androsaceus JB14]|uniref:Acyl-coenzyme A oxidase N-terminal domain-containing protein n=1 Tax=Gymnopus androsaceus JB14 TaxID=1447944 RepID=A0A6A4GWK2_9AGAR|nr:hypothetical protein BT96DRAFT_400227 [Gymnopus androsaceus JB14]
MTQTENYTRGLRMINRMYELEHSLGWSKQGTNVATSLLDDPLPLGLHVNAFEPVFLLQASQELLDKYAGLTATRGIIGCYTLKQRRCTRDDSDVYSRHQETHFFDVSFLFLSLVPPLFTSLGGFSCASFWHLFFLKTAHSRHWLPSQNPGLPALAWQSR